MRTEKPQSLLAGILGEPPVISTNTEASPFDEEPALVEQCGASRTHKKGDIRVGCRETAAKIPANRAGPEHQKPRPVRARGLVEVRHYSKEPRRSFGGLSR